jgi:hypothetical protein
MKKTTDNIERNSLSNLRLPALHVGRGVECGSVTVFPIWTDADGVSGIDWAGRGLVIDEVDGGSVPHLSVTNPTRRAQLILEGDILEGGRQDRMAGETTLVQPGESMVIPVNCVEAGRWNSGRGHRATNLKTAYSVREARRRAFKTEPGRAQGAVWDRISRIEAGLGEHSETSNFKERASARQERLFTSKEQLARGERIQDTEMADHPAMLKPLAGQRGVVIAIGGEIVAAEVFASATAFAERWEGIAIAAGIDGTFVEPRKAKAQDARDFIDAIENAHPVVDGKGTFSWEGRGISVTGVAQERREATVLQFTATNDSARVMTA